MRVFYFLPLLLMLSACGQADYTTWNCIPENDPSKKVVMVLQQSTMKIDDRQLRFCGSLGLVSYFDENCKVGDVKASIAQLIQSESRLAIGSKQYRCEKL
ncbi:hypothetical protein ICV32_03775 [Polynucleobacter sp. MWH-UH24A]|uniref:hypothetical protein n=1 Tax=Polynucleobacter sp. MWH-UH24A TaxID=2689110 RepID=UPI001BFE33FE|nr:hypothetical protein [Polynucleobacter sp. MWH-UH24A]QWD76789.1 hypothetical protein ICV32_03775 [Polynucleobacter sp. MWH-UH24A]